MPKTTSQATANGSRLESLHEPVRDTEAMTGDWLDTIRAHHQMLERAFEELLASDPMSRPVLYKRLAYLLTAHSVAEENVIYPALVMIGLQSDADRLYLDQAHAKVKNAMLDLADDRLGDAWLARSRELRDAVLEHAKADEEGNLYPRLQAAIDSTTARKITAGYFREFLSVKPT